MPTEAPSGEPIDQPRTIPATSAFCETQHDGLIVIGEAVSRSCPRPLVAGVAEQHPEHVVGTAVAR